MSASYNLNDVNRSGRRGLVNERTILSELGRMIHVVKAAQKEKAQVRKAQKRVQAAQKDSTADASGSKKKKKAKKDDNQSRKGKNARHGRSRHSKEGGSVWMVLKGGFDAAQVPLAEKKVPGSVPAAKSQKNQTGDAATLAVHRAMLRLRWRLSQREKNVIAAEAYVDSAWREAESSELIEPSSSKGKNRNQATARGVPTADGAAYLTEQYHVAEQMINGPGVGSVLNTLVRATSAGGPQPSSSASSSAALPATILEQHLSEHKNQWRDVLQREKAICLGLSALGGEEIRVSDEEIREEVCKAWYCVAEEPMPSQKGSAQKSDIKPTKCIIRLRNSQHQKFSAVLHQTKAVNSFTGNILKVLRKELANNSVLPRSGKEEVTAVPTSNAAHPSQHQKPAPQQQSQQQQQQSKSNNKRGGKRKK